MTRRALLVLALAAVPALAAAGGYPAQCGTDTAGMPTGYPQTLSDVNMAPGIKDFTVTVPESVCTNPLHPRHVGTTVTACDQDAAPRVALSDPRRALVSRTGMFVAEQGVVHTTVYCM